VNRFVGALSVCAAGAYGLLAGSRRRPALAVGLGLLLTALWPAGVQAQAVSNGAEAVMIQDARVLAEILPGPSTARSAPDLFGFTTLKLGRTLYDRVWREAAWSALPVADPQLDAFVARLKDLPMRGRVEEANAWINARVSYAPDRFVANHHWGNLAKVLSEGRGEREDIAIAKLQLLAAAGVPRSDMYLVLVQDWWRVAEDYLLVVRDGDQVYVLDSKQDAFEDASQTSRYVPLLAFSADGGWLFAKRRHGRSGGLNASVSNLRRVSLGYATIRPAARMQPSTVSEERLAAGGR
jgi:predicted transglutaminase-like cysteine proteinase